MSSLVMYRIGYHRGSENGYAKGTSDAIGEGRFGQSVAFLASLQKLRAGDIPGTISQIEQWCFSSAHIYYKDPTQIADDSQFGRAQGLSPYPAAGTIKTFANELMKYRAAYRTNSADWDDMERKLVVELAKVK